MEESRVRLMRKRKELFILKKMKNRKYKTRINKKITKEYRAWKAMKSRCYSKCNKNMGNYQKDNIQVCKKWINSFDNFLDDMGFAPSEKHTLDRIDPKKNYCKKNCRWATFKTQSNNRGSFNLKYKYNGEVKNLKEWSEYFNIKYTTLYQRIFRSKLSFEEAIKINN